MANYSDSLAERVRPAIVAEGWQAARESRDPLLLTEPGRAALIAGLRACALSPATAPSDGQILTRGG